MRDFTWSKAEKTCARTAFNQAYEREIQALCQELRERVHTLHDAEDMWAFHDFLTEKRREIDEKYDYRYSHLIFVFARLLREGWLTEDELTGLSAEKRQAIQVFWHGWDELEEA